MRATQFEGFTLDNFIAVRKRTAMHDGNPMVQYEIFDRSRSGEEQLMRVFSGAELMQFCVALSDECAALMKEERE